MENDTELQRRAELLIKSHELASEALEGEHWPQYLHERFVYRRDLAAKEYRDSYERGDLLSCQQLEAIRKQSSEIALFIKERNLF